MHLSVRIIQHHLFRSGLFILALFLSLNEDIWAQASNRLSLGVFYNYNSLSLQRTYQEEILSYDGDEVTDELTQEELDEFNEGMHKKNFHELSMNLFSGLSGDSLSIFRFGAGVSLGMDIGNEKQIYENEIAGFHFKHTANMTAGVYLYTALELCEKLTVIVSPYISYHFGSLNDWQRTDADSIFSDSPDKRTDYDNQYSLWLSCTKFALQYKAGKLDLFAGPEFIIHYYELDYQKTIVNSQNESTFIEKNTIKAMNSSFIRLSAGARYELNHQFSAFLNGSIGKEVVIGVGFSYSFTK